jgi:hypothetical protein
MAITLKICLIILIVFYVFALNLTKKNLKLTIDNEPFTNICVDKFFYLIIIET